MLRSAFLLLLLACATALADSPVAPPAAEQAFNTWLAAFNDGGRAELQAFMDKYKLDYDVQDDLDFQESMGRFKVLEVKASTPLRVDVLILSENNGGGLLATMTLDAKDPSKVDEFQFEGTAVPPEHRPRRMDLEALLVETRSRLEAQKAADKLSGPLLVARGDQVLFEWHGGLADREKEVPVARTTRFRIASLGKMFTAVAILQLADAGKLKLDDSLATHLPDYPNQEVAAKVTLRQMLNHTSGLGNIFGKEVEKLSDGLRTHRDYWGPFAATPLLFTPGSEDKYSNYGYVLLGSVIEAVSGQSYYDYVDEHIYRAAGMVSTGSAPESEAVADRAHAYTRKDRVWTRETASLPWRGTAAGGSYSTVDDLMKFAAALQRGKLVSAESLAAATSPQNKKRWYGYGFMVSGEGAERQFGHEGGAMGANAVMIVFPGSGHVVVGLSNLDPAAMGNVANFVARRLPLEP